MSAQRKLYSAVFTDHNGLIDAWSEMTEKVRSTRHSNIHLESKNPKHDWERCAPKRTMTRSEMKDFVTRGLKINSSFRLSYIIPLGE